MRTDKKISNPLTIIAIFAGLAEINGTVVLSLVPSDLQELFLWFIIFFPSILVIIFFAILNWNPQVLYAPSDFLTDESYLKNIRGNKYQSVILELNKNNIHEDIEYDKLLQISKSNVSEYPNKISEIAKLTFTQIQDGTKELFETDLLASFSYEAQAPGYYLIDFTMNKELLKGNSGRYGDTIIISFSQNRFGEIEIIAIGKNIVETDYLKFSEKIIQFLKGFIEFHRAK